MKNLLLLFAAAGLSTAAFAQEYAAINAEALGLTSSASEVAAGKTLCSSDNVTMNVAYTDNYKTVSLTSESDKYHSLTIGGKTYALPDGVQGATNPSGDLSKPQAGGAVFEFDVKKSGYLYVFSKLTYSKNIYVWAGQAQGSPEIAYSIAVYSPEGTEYKGSLPGDADAVFAAEGILAVEAGKDYVEPKVTRTYIKPDGSNKVTWADYETDASVKETVDAYVAEKGLTIVDKNAENADSYLCSAITVDGTAIATPANIVKVSGGNVWAEGNASGVVAFPVEKGVKYYVNATGSKVTCGGFLFIPGATSLAEIAGSEGSETAVKNITVDELDTNAPIYNLQGQRVGEGYKGICIQNGKKFIVK